MNDDPNTAPDESSARLARPDGEQSRILKALQLEIPERLSPDRLL